ncbi:type VII secretion-associated serine protease mycosin [Streptomyces wuyuanensis]|uniref:Type VII secretion-associated serine protease mycosin n=2 Tax=Streptomyces wuyuanensis TaxID=1196353 RepID=A0A1H0E2Z3_9ACTN|nr:type VII secretion-associated serine protease mycosin [Streptomyces wuyuanensis]
MWSRTSRRAIAFTVVLTGACAAGLVGTAPVAAAADIRSKQWYLDAMHAEEIWKKTTGEGITVAVIDTGVNSSTPSLKGKVLNGLDASDAKGDATDDYSGHGTTMAELIAGTGKGGGLKGLAPGAKILSLRISDTELQNKESVNAHDAEEAIRFAADSDARIISMSFASDFMTQQEIDAVKYVESKGKLFFAGVGNKAEKGNKPQYPANYPEVVGVAATDRDGRVADYSQHGDFVDIAAPGSDIPGWCDTTFTRYCDGDGTSSATALASASAALIWSAHPDWTANQVLRVMFESAARPDGSKDGTLSNYLGHGIVRPNAHINRGLGKPGDPNLSPLTNKRTSGGAPAGSAAPSSPSSSEAPKDKPVSDAVAAGSSTKTEDDDRLGLVLGGAVVVVVLAGVAISVTRKRRNA